MKFGLYCFSFLAFVSAAHSLTAAPLQDAVGDFLPVYVGPQNGDLDVTEVNAFLTTPNEVELVGTHAAPIGTTAGSIYVWGIDRGAGIEPFPAINPPTGQGVFFDAAVVLFPDGTGLYSDVLQGGAPQPLDPATISISGSTISVRLSESLMPTRGLAFADYRYNLWPRYAPTGFNPLDNTQVSDFAPDASTFPASVPEPSTLVLLGSSIAVLGAALRRRRN